MISDSSPSEHGEKKRKAHVVIVGIAFAGHCAPFVQIMYHLEAKYPGITVTFVATKDRIDELTALQSKGDLKGLDLHTEALFGPPPVYHADPKFPVRGAIVAMKNFEECESWRKKLIAEKDAPGRPTAIIADMFQSWSKGFADELGIPWYTYFSVCPLFVLNIVEGPNLAKAGAYPDPLGLVPYNTSELLPTSAFPGFPSIRVGDLSGEIFYFKEFYFELVQHMKQAAGILLNTAEELDAKAGTVVVLRTFFSSSKVLPIGPSLQYPGFGFIYAPTESTSSCLEWLDSQPEKSVLYVAFGSLGSVSKALLAELAAGLEASGVRFLWAVRLVGSAKLSEVLPPGFVERTKERGIVETKWLPQSKILSHPSTGGFLSHSGWNSTLESICAGVPIISWPLSADQLLVARFLHHVAKVGIAICYAKEENQDNYDNVGRREVEKAVRLLMMDDEGQQLRRNLQELVQKSVAASVAEGGSSYRNLNTLLDELALV